MAVDWPTAGIGFGGAANPHPHGKNALVVMFQQPTVLSLPHEVGCQLVCSIMSNSLYDLLCQSRLSCLSRILGCQRLQAHVLVAICTEVRKNPSAAFPTRDLPMLEFLAFAVECMARRLLSNFRYPPQRSFVSQFK